MTDTNSPAAKRQKSANSLGCKRDSSGILDSSGSKSPVPPCTGNLRADTKADNTPKTVAGSGYPVRDASIAPSSSVAPDKTNVLVIGGPSGVGKGTVLKLLLDRHPDLFSFSVSNTTRGPRPGEEDGVHYNFVTQDDFEKAIEKKEMLEYAHVHTNYYGTSSKAVEKVIFDGKCCVLDIDVQGAEQVHAHYVNDPTVLMSFVFFKPPDMEELEKRLRGRGTETEDKIQKRLKNAHTECDTAENKHDFWQFITNEVVEDSYRKLCKRVGVDPKDAPKDAPKA